MNRRLLTLGALLLVGFQTADTQAQDSKQRKERVKRGEVKISVVQTQSTEPAETYEAETNQTETNQESTYQENVYEGETYEEVPGYAYPDSGPSCDCCREGETSWGSSTSQSAYSVGFEFTFLKPRFENNPAFTTMDSDGASFEDFNDTEFDYDLELAPRLWIEHACDNGLGLRALYWQFDHSPGSAVDSPPANGFGRIDNPPFGTVDISSTIPTDTYLATSDLNAFTIDLEATKITDFCSWSLGLSGGLRYAEVEQSYFAELRDAAGTARGRIDFDHRISGVGPTISLHASRTCFYDVIFFGMARGSLLYGDGESRLAAGEDLDLANPFFTNQVSQREDLLPIGEMQIGIDWSPPVRSAYQPFMSLALEAQFWNGVGNATSEDGNLGFFGFKVGLGAVY